MKSRSDLVRKNFLSAYAFFLLTALAYFCGQIYTIFTHGEISKSLSSVWVFLLVAGAGVRTLTAIIFTILQRRPRKIASDLYDSGVIAYTAGMTMRGIFEIFGSDKNLIVYYEVAGIGLMAAGILLIAACSQKLSVYNAEINVFDIFLAERTVERNGARIEARELYSLHNKWARESGYYPLSKKKYIAELSRRYHLLRCGVADDYTVIGIALRD